MPKIRYWLTAALAAMSVAHGAAAQDSTQTNQKAAASSATTAVPATTPGTTTASPTAAKATAAKSATAKGTASATSAKTEAAAKAAAPAGKSAAAVRVRYKPDRFAGRAGTYYKQLWGVDSLGVKTVESGEVIRFSYRVLDPDRARTLNDEKVEPSLIDPQAGVSLVVPSLEKVGKLRQSETPEEGKSYWMAFSNKGRLVKRGDRVNVVIGQFHANGLVVD
jgi:hypothetical protein